MKKCSQGPVLTLVNFLSYAFLGAEKGERIRFVSSFVLMVM